MRLTGKRIVITGATGFLGKHVAEQMLLEGAMVTVLVRPESVKKLTLHKNPQLQVIEGTFLRMEDYVVQIGQADGFFHFAWGGVNREEIDSNQIQQKNVDGSLACVKAARALGCQVFFDAGSRVEYGITQDGRMEETMECHPVNAYGKAKLQFYQEAAKLCKTWGMTYYHLRFFSVYGVGDHPWSIISTLVRELPKGETVSLSACLHQWNFMEIRDAAEAVILLYSQADHEKGGCHIVNIASKDTRQLREFAEEIHRLCGGRGCLEFGSFQQAKEGALSICPEVKVLEELTHGAYRDRVPFEAGINGMLRYEEENR